MKSLDCYFLLEMRSRFKGNMDRLTLSSEHWQTPLDIEQSQKGRMDACWDLLPPYSCSACLFFFTPGLLIWEFPSSVSESLCTLHIGQVVWAERCCTRFQVVHLAQLDPAFHVQEEEYRGIWRARRRWCCEPNARPPDCKTRLSPDAQKQMWMDLFLQ